jgi:hypothetical protein
MRILLLAIFLSIWLQLRVYSQDTDFSEYVPQGYSILSLTKGNLNLDNIEDVVLVLKKVGEDSVSTIGQAPKRTMLILIGQEDCTYKLFAENENVVYFYNYDPNFQDAFEGVSIENGNFTIVHYGGFAQRWGRTTTFKYNPSVQNWFLSADEYSVMDATAPLEPNKIIHERKRLLKELNQVPFSKFSIYEELK